MIIIIVKHMMKYAGTRKLRFCERNSSKPSLDPGLSSNEETVAINHPKI
jgi:hypothetical protein